ncbi:MAG TPA: hypothetical protein VG944_04635 [Fimbriimonas sp.]|nr:hypothetical protein [Fimbriimonas sp.]
MGLLLFLGLLLLPGSASAQSLKQVSVTPSSVVGGDGATGNVTLTSAAPAGGFLVQINCAHDYVQFPTAVAVPGGQVSTSFALGTTPVTHSSTASITFSANSQTLSAAITVLPPLFPIDSITTNPDPVVGGQNTVGTVTLNQVAGLAGITVQLSSNKTYAKVPASVTVPHGASSANFTIKTSLVSTSSSATITGSVLGVTGTATDDITVNPWPVASVQLTPNPVTGSFGVNGVVTLGARAPFGGITVQLSSDQSFATPVTTTVIVKQGYLTAPFRVKTSVVGAQGIATISATTGGTPATTPLTVNAPPVVGLTFSPTTIYGGGSVQGTVTTSIPAPTGGESIQLSKDANDVTIPSTVTIAAGFKSAKFTVTTVPRSSPETVNVTATGGGAQISTPFTVQTHVQIVQVQVRDMAYDSVSGKIWATVGSGGGQYANSVVAIDPATGNVGTQISLPVEPSRIAITDDGQFAYVTANSDGTIRRIDLGLGIKGPVFNIHDGGVIDIVTMPGQPHTYVVCNDPSGGVNATAFDDDVAKVGTGAVGYHMIAAGDASGIIYGDGHGGMFTDIVTATQLKWTDQTTFNISGGVWANNSIYTNVPNRVKPSTKTILLSFPTSNFLVDREVAVSTSDNRAYYVTWDPVTNKRILCFDAVTGHEYPFIDTGLVPGGSQKLIACDNHTVAYFNFGSGVTPEVVIIRGLP